MVKVEERITCPYCGKEPSWTQNKVVYGRNYGKSYMCYYCFDCDAYVGCHYNTRKPLGTMANKELRALRRKAHSLFDPIWQLGILTRRQAYRLLEEKTGVKHIGESTEEECKVVIDVFTNMWVKDMTTTPRKQT